MAVGVLLLFYLQIPDVSGYTFEDPFDTKAIECYVCDRQTSNFNCIEDDKQVICPQGFDTCMTTVEFSDVSEKMFITKKCSKNPACSRQVNQTRVTHPCDKSLPSWICTQCCYSDYCNHDSGVRTVFHWSSYLLWLVMILHYVVNAT